MSGDGVVLLALKLLVPYSAVFFLWLAWLNNQRRTNSSFWLKWLQIRSVVFFLGSFVLVIVIFVEVVKVGCDLKIIATALINNDARYFYNATMAKTSFVECEDAASSSFYFYAVIFFSSVFVSFVTYRAVQDLYLLYSLPLHPDVVERKLKLVNARIARLNLYLKREEDKKAKLSELVYNNAAAAISAGHSSSVPGRTTSTGSISYGSIPDVDPTSSEVALNSVLDPFYEQSDTLKSE